MQIFANPECTEYADGTTMPVYARVNVPWSGVNSGWQTGGQAGASIMCTAPTTDTPGDPYWIRLWVDFGSNEGEQPFTAGQILEIDGDNSYLPVTNPTVIFTKPA